MKLYFVLLIKSHLLSYPCPIIINYLWNIGFLLGITIILQIITGIFSPCQEVRKIGKKSEPNAGERKNESYLPLPSSICKHKRLRITNAIPCTLFYSWPVRHISVQTPSKPFLGVLGR